MSNQIQGQVHTVVNLHRDGAATATTHIQANKDQHMIDESSLRRTQNPQSQSPDKDKAKVQTPVKASKIRPSE